MSQVVVETSAVVRSIKEKNKTEIPFLLRFPDANQDMWYETGETADVLGKMLKNAGSSFIVIQKCDLFEIRKKIISKFMTA